MKRGFHYFIIRKILFGARNRYINSEECRAKQQGIGHIIAVSHIYKLYAAKRFVSFINRKKISHGLAWMKGIRQSVYYRYNRVPGEFYGYFMRVCSYHDAVDIS